MFCTKSNVEDKIDKLSNLEKHVEKVVRNDENGHIEVHLDKEIEQEKFNNKLNKYYEEVKNSSKLWPENTKYEQKDTWNRSTQMVQDSIVMYKAKITGGKGPVTDRKELAVFEKDKVVFPQSEQEVFQIDKRFGSNYVGRQGERFDVEDNPLTYSSVLEYLDLYFK